MVLELMAVNGGKTAISGKTLGLWTQKYKIKNTHNLTAQIEQTMGVVAVQ
jgi:hypothetical protein